MKKNICILAGLLTFFLLFCTVNAQEYIPPIPDIPHDKEPTVLKRVDPVYPESMLRNGSEATVYMKALIGVDGNVIEAKIEKIQVTANNIIIDNNGKFTGQKKDGKAFEEASYNAVKQWKFSPAQMQGKPVAVWITIPFRFKLSKKEAKPEEETNRAETEKRVESIKTLIENILKGVNINQAKKYIIPDAYLVYGKYYESLYSVLNGEHKKIKLIEGPESKGVFFHITISDDETNAWIYLKTQIKSNGQSRFHTVILIKTENSDWQIKHWHVSF